MIFGGRPARPIAGLIAGLLAGLGVVLGAGEFAPPAEGPVAFRRDQLPLDEEAMAGLSKQLESLARRWLPTTARDRRGAAQMLALALALDPANASARDLIAEYQKGRHLPAADAGRLDPPRSRILAWLAWLESPEAGTHGHALAACLQDILVTIDRQHPTTAETGAWAAWIPNVAAYETRTVVKTGEVKPQAPAVEAGTQKEVPLSTAEVQTLLWRNVGGDEAARWILAVAPLQMTATQMREEPTEPPRPFSLVIGSAQNGSLFAPTCAMLLKLLQTQHPSLPPGYRVAINSSDLEQSLRSRQRQTLSAAAAVLASSAITGREPSAIILGQIDETGAFKLPSDFWDQLQALGKGTGQRLVLPAEAAACLPAMLAMEKPGFFLEYEVLLAGNFKQLLDLTAKQPDAALVTASAKFRAVRERVGTQDLRQYLTNHFVRQRLADIQLEAPCHQSAKMLLLQALGNRPIWVPRAVLAAELRRAIEPMTWIVRSSDSAPSDPGVPLRSSLDSEWTSAEIAKLAPTIERCRSRVDELDHHADKDERDLIDQTHKVISGLRALERATRLRGESYVIQKAIRSASGDLASLHAELMVQLGREGGE